MTRRLLFFDARDTRQVRRARELIAHYQGSGQADPHGRLLPGPDEVLAHPRVLRPARSADAPPRYHPGAGPRVAGRHCACASTRWRCIAMIPLSVSGSNRARQMACCTLCVMRGVRCRQRPRLAPGKLHRTRSPTSAGACILPISIGGARIGDLGDQEDIANPSKPAVHLRRQSGDRPVHRVLGARAPRRSGAQAVLPRPRWAASTSIRACRHPRPRDSRAQKADGDGGSFYQAHFYVNPVLYVSRGGDRLPVPGTRDAGRGLPDRGGSFVGRRRAHADHQARTPCCSPTRWRSPPARPTAWPHRSASASASCSGARAARAASIPLNGHVPYHMGGVRTSALMAQRLTAKMHRELIAWGWHGQAGLVRPLLRAGDGQGAPTRRNSPTPFPTTDKEAGKMLPALRAHDGHVGRRASEYPVRGEDFSLHVVSARGTAVSATRTSTPVVPRAPRRCWRLPCAQ
jgi:conjugal transfer pilus assembly protein TraU